MTTKLNKHALDFAQNLIREAKFVVDDKDDWSEHQPSTDEENTFLERYGMKEFSKWHLGIDDEKNEDTKGAYSFPYGDFLKAHRCGIIAAETRAGQYKHD